MKRRTYLKLAGASGVAVGGSMLLHRGQRPSSDMVEKGGPPDRNEWTLAFQDRFKDGSLDREKWGTGWGWGWNTETSPTRASDENIRVTDNTLRLRGTHDGDDIVSGIVNTKNTVSFGPESYIEAKIRFARRSGFLNAFWAKPVSEVWPPEIDIVELFQRGNPGDRRRTHHHLHYSSSTRPGDDTTYKSVDTTTKPGDDLTENFHVYGLEWRENRLIHYLDGKPIQEWTDDVILDAMDIDIPFYLMLSLNIDNVGIADRSEEWGEEMAVDWVRLWEAADDNASDISSSAERE